MDWVFETMRIGVVVLSPLILLAARSVPTFTAAIIALAIVFSASIDGMVEAAGAVGTAGAGPLASRLAVEGGFMLLAICVACGRGSGIVIGEVMQAGPRRDRVVRRLDIAGAAVLPAVLGLSFLV
ncbi:MAG: hypothetical protein AAFV86_20515 [Pseudomonadota bacterium]